jgi:hypothetical protein
MIQSVQATEHQDAASSPSQAAPTEHQARAASTESQAARVAKAAASMAKAAASNTAHSIITWGWTKKLLHWLIISAGTVSECAFLIASLWMSINASVHPLVMLAMTEETAVHISEFATAAYVALPELILGLACVVTIGHIRVWMYNKKDYRAAIWALMYGVPTLVFLTLSLITLGCSVTSTSFIMPEPLIVTRALAGYIFAFTSLLYTQLGTPQERDRLADKDITIATLTQEKTILQNESKSEQDKIMSDWHQDAARLNAIVSQLKEEIENQKELLTESKQTQTALLKAVNKSSEDALAAYSEECQNWLKSGVKSVSIEDINHYTYLPKLKIRTAIKNGPLQVSPRNKELILVSSLVEWLKHTPAPPAKVDPDTAPMLQIVNG